MNSFIPWVGGKSQLRKQILERFPKDKPHRYIEVFGGAGWVLFARDNHAPMEVLNDWDGQLINLYRCIQHHCGELQKELRWAEAAILNSRELFENYRGQLAVEGLTDIQRAARYFYLIRASFGADHRSFGCHKAALEKPLVRLPEIQKRLQNVVIENRDFEDVIKCYDHPGALFYLDPPYYGAEYKYTGFSQEDHRRLQRCVEGIKGRFLLSYNDHPEIRQLYEGHAVQEVARSNSLTSKQGGGRLYKEVLVSNYDL